MELRGYTYRPIGIGGIVIVPGEFCVFRPADGSGPLPEFADLVWLQLQP